MKPVALALALLLLLSACGQAGSLYLPDQKPADGQKREQQKQQPGP